MNRHQLVKLAAEHKAADKSALKIAEEGISAGTAAVRAAVFRARIQKTAQFFGILRYLFGGVLAFGALACAARVPMNYAVAGQVVSALASGGVVILLMMGAALIGVVFIFGVEDLVADCWANSEKFRQFEPIAGTAQCLQALEYLESDNPLVAQWRDIAIRERGQLLGFDCDIMRVLKDCRDEAQRASDVSAACRKVHGLPSYALA